MDDHVALMCVDPNDLAPDQLWCSAPGSNVEEGVEALEFIGSGGMLGTGARMAKLGVDMPRFREAYKAEIELFIKALEQRRARLPKGNMMAAKELARWAVTERLRIARKIRFQQGIGATVLLEIRDQYTYGRGGRNYPNMLHRYRARGMRGRKVYEGLLDGAAKPNQGVSAGAIKGARYLKHGGRVLLVISLATSAAVLLTAPEEDLERLFYEEAGAFAGGALGSGVAVGLCLAFGIASGGWGLLACGLIGGVGGSFLGDAAGSKLYYTSHVDELDRTGALDFGLIEEELGMCLP